jgi:hypothetical protein
MYGSRRLGNRRPPHRRGVQGRPRLGRANPHGAGLDREGLLHGLHQHQAGETGPQARAGLFEALRPTGHPADRRHIEGPGPAGGFQLGLPQQLGQLAAAVGAAVAERASDSELAHRPLRAATTTTTRPAGASTRQTSRRRAQADRGSPPGRGRRGCGRTGRCGTAGLSSAGQGRQVAGRPTGQTSTPCCAGMAATTRRAKRPSGGRGTGWRSPAPSTSRPCERRPRSPPPCARVHLAGRLAEPARRRTGGVRGRRGAWVSVTA